MPASFLPRILALGPRSGLVFLCFPGLPEDMQALEPIFPFWLGHCRPPRGCLHFRVGHCHAPEWGGYFFVSRSFGGLWGTVTGISQWVGLIFACSFYMVRFGEYVQTLLEELHIPWAGLTQIFSLVFTLLLLGINMVGTKEEGRFQNMMVTGPPKALIIFYAPIKPGFLQPWLAVTSIELQGHFQLFKLLLQANFLQKSVRAFRSFVHIDH